MNNKAFWLSILAVIVSFFGGFLFANALNKNELESLRIENNRLKTTPEVISENKSELSLSDEELRRKISEADQNSENIQIQKTIGTALYRYAVIKQDSKLLAEVARILNRVYTKNPNDKETAINLGNTYFDIGYFDKNNENLIKSREIYQKILEQSPKDADVRTDLGLTYFLHNPPDFEKAEAEIKKALQDNPKHEKSLLFLAQILVKLQKNSEAESYLAKLKEINPNAPSLSEVQQQLAATEKAN